MQSHGFLLFGAGHFNFRPVTANIVDLRPIVTCPFAWQTACWRTRKTRTPRVCRARVITAATFSTVFFSKPLNQRKLASSLPESGHAGQRGQPRALPVRHGDGGTLLTGRSSPGQVLTGGTRAVDLFHVPLCRHDHGLKHAGGWRLGQSEPGNFVWTSPLGQDLPRPAPAHLPVTDE